MRRSGTLTQAGCILVTRVFNERSRTGIAPAVTGRSQRVGLPLDPELATNDFPKPPRGQITQTRTLSAERTGRKIGPVFPEEPDPNS